MAARFFVLHHASVYALGVEHAGIVKQGVGVGLVEARDQPFAQHPALGIAAAGIEAEADDRFSFAERIGEDGDDADGHL